MQQLTTLTNNLGSGEISPKQEARVDSIAYQTGCRTMKNALPMPGGGFRRFPGTYFDGYGYSSGTKKGLLFFFPAKSGAIYTCEFSNLIVQFWKSDFTKLQYSAADFTLAHTLLEAELFEAQMKVINGELWIVHHNHLVQKIAESSPAPLAISTPTFTGARTFSATGDYPSVIAVVAARLMLAATDNETETYFVSRAPNAATGIYRLTDFTTGTNPDDAIIGFATDGLGSRIRWAEAHKRVVAGLDQSTYADAGGFPTAGSFYLDAIGYEGVATLQAAKLKNYVLYVGAPSPSLHLLAYSQEGGGLMDVDVTREHDHILKPGVKQLAAMISPHSILFAVRTDGVLVSATFDQEQAGTTYVGFGRQYPADSGTLESAAVMRTPSGDILWLEIKRGTKYCIEHIRILEDDDFSEIHYVDSGIRWVGAETDTVSGLGHLEGKTVHAIADGASMPAVVVSGGQAVYAKTFTKIHVGLPLPVGSGAMEVTPTRPELQANFTWQGKKKQVVQTILRMYNSYAGKVGADLDSLQKIVYTGLPDQPLGEGPAPFTGDYEIPLAGNISPDGTITIVQDEPFPLTVLGMITRLAPVEA